MNELANLYSPSLRVLTLINEKLTQKQKKKKGDAKLRMSCLWVCF